MPEIKGDYQGKLKTIKATADAKLETVSAIEAGSAIIGNIDRVATVGQIDHLGTVEHVNRIDDFGTIKNIPQVYDLDYLGYYDLLAESIGLCTSPGINSGTFMPLSVNAGGKLILDTLGTVERVKDIDNLGTVGRLETIGMIEGGTISEVTHVGTIGDITHLGSIGNVNRIDDLGTVKNIPWVWDTANLKYSRILQYANGLITSPGLYGSDYKALSVNAAGKLILATLGTVERVKDIDNVGTVGRLETIGMIEAGTISEVGHLGTIGDINHLGSIGNTSFNQGAVADHDRWMYFFNGVSWSYIMGTANSAYTVPKAERAGTVYNLRANRDRDLVTAPGWTGSRRVKLLTDDDWQLKTAPARSRKGVVQTVANAGTAVALVASSTPVIGVIVKAQHEYLGTIYVGDSTVDDTHGFLLRRDEFISFSCQNAGSVYIDASRNAQKVSALYINY